jgi:HEAT repeat protein
LGEIGPGAGIASVDALINALQDDTYAVREAAASALGRLGPFACKAVPALEAALADPRFAARVEAAVALSRTGGNAEAALRILLEELQNPGSAYAAAQALGGLGDQARGAVPRLRELLRSDSSETRWCAAIAVGGIGTAARDALPELQSLRDDEDADIRSASAAAIERISDCLIRDDRHGSTSRSLEVSGGNGNSIRGNSLGTAPIADGQAAVPHDNDHP